MKKQDAVSVPDKRAATDWERLWTLSDEDVRSAIEADPEVRPTDAKFWKNATVAFPRIGPRQ